MNSYCTLQKISVKRGVNMRPHRLVIKLSLIGNKMTPCGGKFPPLGKYCHQL